MATIYTPINADEHRILVCDKTATHLDLTVLYHKGRGIYLHIWPVVREGYSTGSEPFSDKNRSVLLESLTRGNSKKELRYTNIAKDMAREIAEAYFSDDMEAIRELMMAI